MAASDGSLRRVNKERLCLRKPALRPCHKCCAQNGLQRGKLGSRARPGAPWLPGGHKSRVCGPRACHERPSRIARHPATLVGPPARWVPYWCIAGKVRQAQRPVRQSQALRAVGASSPQEIDGRSPGFRRSEKRPCLWQRWTLRLRLASPGGGCSLAAPLGRGAQEGVLAGDRRVVRRRAGNYLLGQAFPAKLGWVTRKIFRLHP